MYKALEGEKTDLTGFHRSLKTWEEGMKCFQMSKLSDQKGETKQQVHAGPLASAKQQLVADMGNSHYFP